MAGKRKRDDELASHDQAPHSSSKHALAKLGDFVVMRLQYPAVLQLPSVQHFLYLRAHAGTQDLPQGRTLFIVNIPPDAGEKGLRDLFSRYGVIERVVFRGGAREGDLPDEELEEPAESEASEDEDEEDDMDDELTGAGNGGLAGKRRGRPSKSKDPGPKVVPLPPLPEGLCETGASAHIVFLDPSSLSRSLRPPPAPIPYNVQPKSGLRYYLAVHTALRPPLSIARQHADTYIEAYDYARVHGYKTASRKKGEPIVDDDGFTLVTRGGKAGRTVGGGVGVATKSFELQAKGIAPSESRNGRGRKKKKSQEMPDFYRFQEREKKRQKFMELRRQFEKDKEAVARLRQSRYRPY